ncbi:MAG: hypothetical protein ACREIH_03430 [Nitrospiraceae bacterium]
MRQPRPESPHSLHWLAFAVSMALLLTWSEGLTQTYGLLRDPVEVVKKYVSLDQKGIRLESISWETIRPYVNWKEEPTWGHVMVTSSYKIVDDIKQWEVINMMEVLIPVEYQVLGAVYWEAPGFLPEKQIERVKFRVKAVGGRWRIIEPILPPHVGQKRMINYVRQAMLQELEPSRLAILTALRDELQKAK